MTVRMPPGDSTALHHVAGLVGTGDVVVVVCGGDRTHAAVGEVVVNALLARQAEALIVDGPCTDIDPLLRLGLPIYSRGTTALTTKLLGIDDFSIQAPVSCGGVTVMPGDIVLADANGVAIINPDILADLLPQALQDDQEEPALIRKLWAGELLGDMFGATEMINRLASTHAISETGR